MLVRSILLQVSAILFPFLMKYISHSLSWGFINHSQRWYSTVLYCILIAGNQLKFLILKIIHNVTLWGNIYKKNLILALARYAIKHQVSFSLALVVQFCRRGGVQTAVWGDPDLRLVHLPGGAAVLPHLCWLHLPHHQLHQLLYRQELHSRLGAVLTITFKLY